MELVRKPRAWERISKGDGPILDPLVAEVLAEPVEKEDQLLDAVRQSGGDETLEKAAAVYARSFAALRDAFDGSIPEAVRKELGLPARRPKLALVPAPKPTPSLLDKPLPTPTRTREENAMAKLEEDDKRDWERLESATREIRKADPSLTEAQAYVQALDRNRDAYEGAMRHGARQNTVRKSDKYTPSAEETAIEKRLDKAADAIRARKGNEHLSREQAVVKALDENPDLYAS